jgi:hypothetical protein
MLTGEGLVVCWLGLFVCSAGAGQSAQGLARAFSACKGWTQLESHHLTFRAPLCFPARSAACTHTAPGPSTLTRCLCCRSCCLSLWFLRRKHSLPCRLLTRLCRHLAAAGAPYRRCAVVGQRSTECLAGCSGPAAGAVGTLAAGWCRAATAAAPRKDS